MPASKPQDYRRPTLPFERKATRLSGAAQWSAAGLEFGFAVVLFFLGGRFLDANLGTAPWLSVAGSLVGIGVGTYLLLRQALRASSGGGTDGGAAGPDTTGRPPISPRAEDPTPISPPEDRP